MQVMFSNTVFNVKPYIFTYLEEYFWIYFSASLQFQEQMHTPLDQHLASDSVESKTDKTNHDWYISLVLFKYLKAYTVLLCYASPMHDQMFIITMLITFLFFLTDHLFEMKLALISYKLNSYILVFRTN